MSFYRGMMSAGAALLATTVAAQAADLYGGYGGRGSLKDDHVAVAPRGCPTWYVRLDGGYSTFDRPGLSQVGIDDLVWPRVKDTGSIGGGIGYHFTCQIRGDITVDYRFKNDITGFNGNIFAPNFGPMRWGYESTVVMSNYYYDFDWGSRFTPYVGFGFGAAENIFHRGTGVVGAGAPTAGNPTVVNGGSGWHVAGAAMAGFAFQMTERLKLDTGYRFLYLGAGQTGFTADRVTNGIGGVVHVENLHAHEFRIGLRYDIR